MEQYLDLICLLFDTKRTAFLRFFGISMFVILNNSRLNAFCCRLLLSFGFLDNGINMLHKIRRFINFYIIFVFGAFLFKIFYRCVDFAYFEFID